MHVIIHLSTEGRRAAAAAALNAATDELDPLAAVTFADVLDGVSAGVLRAAGVDDEEARAILALLWSDR